MAEGQTSEQPPVPRGLLMRVALLGAGCGIALGLAEILVLVSGAAPQVAQVAKGRYRLSANPKIGYEPIPGFSQPEKDATYFAHDYFDYRSSETNSMGFRDDEPAAQPSPGMERVVVLGDSITVGLGISERADIFTEVAERALAAAGQPTELINQAVVGYNTQQEVEAFIDKGLALQPDRVVLAYCLNDRGGRSDGWLMGALLHEAEHTQTLLPSSAAPLAQRSALYRFLRYRVLAAPDQTSTAAAARQHTISQDHVDPYLQILGELSRAHGFEVIVAIFPLFDDPSIFGDLQDYHLRDEHARVTLSASAAGLQTLDLLQDFQACERDNPEGLAIDQTHPNRAGHRCAGEAIARYLMDESRAMERP